MWGVFWGIGGRLGGTRPRTYFGPICGPSSGCNLTYRAAIQDVWVVFWGVLGVGWGRTRSRCFSSGYHDLGLL